MNKDFSTPSEISSGKDIAYENFPVGSWLLPAHLRPHIATFYHFARAADDLADSPDLSAEEKIEELTAFEQAVMGKTDEQPPQLAIIMAESLAQTGTTPQHCLDLLTAFKQDATKNRYTNWAELIGYCQLSAAPVGRYLLDLHGGSKDGYGPSDALCNALQILNHLQDCQDDLLTLDRAYLPLDILKKHEAAIDNLRDSAMTLGLRRSLDEILNGVDDLLKEASKLPGGLRSRRLAMESQVILNIARKLSLKLRNVDVLSSRVELSKPQYLVCFLSGAFGALFK